jgi:hypothetical protein
MFRPTGRNIALAAQLYCGVRYLPRWTDLQELYIIIDPIYLCPGNEASHERLCWMTQAEVLFRHGNRAFISLDVQLLNESDIRLREAVNLYINLTNVYYSFARPIQHGGYGCRRARYYLVTWRPRQ